LKSAFLTDFFGSCGAFEAPLTLKCLQDIWTKKTECTMDGKMYPSRANPDILAQIWGIKNQKCLYSVFLFCKFFEVERLIHNLVFVFRH